MSDSSLPWIIALISLVVFGTVAISASVLLFVSLRDANNIAASAQVVDELWLESIEQRLESVEHWFYSNDQRNESIEQRLGSIENRFGSIEQRIDSIEQFHVWHGPPPTVGLPPPIGPQVWHELRPFIPPGGYREHFVEPGQSLASIAQIYWPHNPETPSGRAVRDQLIYHLATTNNIANPEVIFVGTWLKIYEHPHIAQPLEWRH